MKGKIKVLTIIAMMTGVIGCGKTQETVKVEETPMTLEQIVTSAKAEGKISSVGIPDDWANWGGNWRDYSAKYGISHVDRDMSSAEEIALFKAEGKNASADIGDIGFDFSEIAISEGVTQPYKNSNWDKIPDWAKNRDGHHALAYTGTMSFIVDKTKVAKIPTSWQELFESNLKISIGDVGKASQANSAMLALAFAKGGDESNIDEAYRYFAEISKQGRLSSGGASIANLEKGEVEVGILWDFNALGYRAAIDKDRFAVVIPSDGSLVSGYGPIINKYAKNPNAAKLMLEFVFSEQGQLNFAKGYARPIRSDIEYPAETAVLLLPKEQYVNARPIKDFNIWRNTVANMTERWENEVLAHKKQ